MLTVEEETLQDLVQIGLPLNVVTIAGLYRTGKSYLMNRLVGVNKGFALGNTIQSKTKGIWVWCLMHPEQQGHVLMLLDTEGLGDIEKGDSNHDNRLFTIAVLLSSTLVYNIMGAFNQESLDKITFITEISKNMKLTANGKQDDILFDSIFPVFVLCLRDFFLDMPGTPTHYLNEVCLKLKPGNGPDIKKFNKPRELLRKYFKVRECFTFERPGGRNVLKRLEEITDSDLSPDFIEDTVKFTSYVYTCPPKMLQPGKTVNGRMLASLAKSYVGAMRNGAVPCVKDALSEMAEAENTKIVEAVISKFSEQLSEVELPQSDKGQFQMKYCELRSKVFEKLREKLVNDENRKFEDAASKKMSDLWETARKKNDEILKKQHWDVLEKMYEKIAEKVKQGEYKRAGGYAVYREHVESMRKEFLNVARGDKYLETLKEFEESKKDHDQEIMHEDQKLCISKEMEEKLKQLERDNAERKRAEMEQMERERKEMEKKERKQEEKFRAELEEQRKRQQELELEAMRAEQARIMALKDAELARQLQEGAANAEKLRKENEEAHRRLKEQENSGWCTIS